MRVHCYLDGGSTALNDSPSDGFSVHALNDEAFLDHLASCRAYVGSAGFESICEAFYLGKPVLAVPTAGHYEQTLNGWDAQRAGAARVGSYDDLESFYVENRVEDFEEWAWRTFDSRVDYRSLRSSSKLAYRRSGYVIAIAALNRVVASVFAWQAVKASRGDFDEPDETGASATQGAYHLDISSPSIGARGEFSAAVSLIRSF